MNLYYVNVENIIKKFDLNKKSIFVIPNLNLESEKDKSVILKLSKSEDYLIIAQG